MSLSRTTRSQIEYVARTNASELFLLKNDLESLPSEICRLTELKELAVGGNHLTSLPSEIGQLASLTRLSIEDNKLRSLPSELAGITGLQALLAYGNLLTDLPTELWHMPSLQELNLDRNRLEELPSEIGNLTGLRKLSLEGNQLDSVPPEIGQLTNLESLKLSHNRLQNLPSELGQLINLRELRLSGNQLTSLPPDIGRLSSLQTLIVEGNHLTSLPPELGRLTKLTSLQLDANQFTLVPQAITDMTELLKLTLSRNQLTRLPPEIGLLTKIQLLSLEQNRLTVLPKTLANLFHKGLSVRLSGNRLMEPLPELLARGSAAVASYLASLEDAIAQYEAKAVLVGEGNVGKTSLISALRDEPFIKDRPTTHGIEVSPLVLRHPSLDRNLTLRAWDFGGQEIYRVTHQFFFSRRAIYLVVWHSREGQEQNEVEDWLRRIRLRIGNDARAMIIATHCKERRPQLDYPYLEQTFPGMLAGQYAVDSSDATGVATLRNALADQSARLPQMGQLISPRWLDARDEILSMADAKWVTP